MFSPVHNINITRRIARHLMPAALSSEDVQPIVLLSSHCEINSLIFVLTAVEF